MSILTITGTNRFSEIIFDGVQSRSSLSIVLPANVTTTIGKWSVYGKSENLVTLKSSSPGEQFILNLEKSIKPTDLIDWLYVSDGIGNPDTFFYIGTNSIDGGNNQGFSFDYAADLTITGANTFAEIEYPGAIANKSINIRFPNESTSISKWSINGSTDNPVRLLRTGNVGQFSLNYIGFRNISTGGLIISNGIGLPEENWYVGLNSQDNGNNRGFVFDWARMRFWVGGSGIWTQSDTANWSYSSGSIGGAPAPTINDEAIFDENSSNENYSITIAPGAKCKTLIVDENQNQTLTLLGNSDFDLYGGIILPEAGFINQFTGKINFKAFSSSNFIDTKGHTITPNDVTFDGFNANWTVISDLSAATDVGRCITFKMGSFNAQDVYITTRRLVTEQSFGDKQINLGSATITLIDNDPNLPIIHIPENSIDNLTFAGQNSHIIINSATPGILDVATGVTFADITWSNGNINEIIINGSNTFRDINIAPRSTIGITKMILNSDQVLTGTLNTQEGSIDPRQRLLICSNIIGEQRRITAQNTQLRHTDFLDIQGAGLATWSSATIGDRGGCTGISFPQPRNVYWNLAGNHTWIDNGWTNFPQGVPNIAYFPLPHDVCVFADNANIDTISIDSRFPIGSIQTLSRNSTMTIDLNEDIDILGDLRLSNVISFTGNGTIAIKGRKVQNILSGNITFPCNIEISAPNTTLRLDDNMTLAEGNSFHLIQGTLDLFGKQLTADALYCHGSSPRSLLLSHGVLSLKGTGNVWNVTDRDGLMLDVISGTIRLMVPSVQTFVGGGLNYGTIEIVDNDSIEERTVTIVDSNVFNVLRNSHLNSIGLKLVLPDYTEVNRWEISGKSDYLVNLVGNNNEPFVLHKLTTGVAVSDYLNLTNSIATPKNTWYAGDHSIDGGGNDGWRFQYPVLSGFIAFFDY